MAPKNQFVVCGGCYDKSASVDVEAFSKEEALQKARAILVVKYPDMGFNTDHMWIWRTATWDEFLGSVREVFKTNLNRRWENGRTLVF